MRAPRVVAAPCPLTCCSIFWTGLFGAFAARYHTANCGNDFECKKMKVAVWFDLVGMLLWFTTAACMHPPPPRDGGSVLTRIADGGIMFWRDRYSTSRITRAGVV